MAAKPGLGGVMIGEIILREVTDDDLPVLFEQQLDRAANYMAAFTTEDPTDWVRFMAHWTRIRADAGVILRTIVFRGRVAGYVAGFERGGEPEISYWLGKEYWGQGVATAALASFLELVTVRPLYARAARDNAASLRVLEKCGFGRAAAARFFANARGMEVEEVILVLHGEA